MPSVTLILMNHHRELLLVECTADAEPCKPHAHAELSGQMLFDNFHFAGCIP